MAELAAWNEAHADAALKYGQAHLVTALAVDHRAEEAAYRANRARDLAVAGEHGIDATLAAADAAAVVTPVLARRRGGGAGRLPQPGRAGRLPPVRPAPVRGRRSWARPGPRRCCSALGFGYEQAASARRPVSEVNPSLLR